MRPSNGKLKERKGSCMPSEKASMRLSGSCGVLRNGRGFSGKPVMKGFRS